MDRYQKVYLTVYAAVASLCWYILDGLVDQQHIALALEPLQKYINVPIEYFRGIAIPVILFGLVLLFRMSDFISRAIIEKIPIISRLLRRLLSRRKDIEGDWPLVVVDMERRKLLYLGFLNIKFRNGQNIVQGDDWTIDGNYAHAFRSVQSLYRDYKLQYWYEQGESLHSPDMRGYTEIYFFPKYRLAERHAGKFLDPKHVSDIRFYAVRQKYRLFERRPKTKDQKLDAARALWAQIEPQLSTLYDRKIDSDFGS